MNSNDTNIVNAAIATMRRRNLPVGRLVQMKRICAVHGTAWAAQYREIGGRWKLERCVRPSSGANGTGVPVPDFTIDAATVDGGVAEICPWCGCGPKDVGGDLTLHVRCPACGNTVCLGRTTGTTFRCCDRCGKTGQIGGTITSYTASDAGSAGRGLLGGKSGTVPALSAPSRLRLTGGR